jgi:GNAT superfamily N-acetyltransferase
MSRRGREEDVAAVGAMERRPAGLCTDSVADARELSGLSLDGLSAEFRPFLPLFVEQVLRRGGEVLVRRSEDRAEGLLLHVPEERAGSLFAKELASLVALAGERAPASYFVEHRAATVVDELDIWAVDLTAGRPTPPLRHPVRAAAAGDRDSIARLSEAVGGPAEPKWIRPLDESGATCWVADGPGRIVGVGWAERVGGAGRVHSAFVDPRYRGIGVGSDLLEARLRWLAAAGAQRAISEISRSNVVSRRAAERSGMRPSAPMYLARFP